MKKRKQISIDAFDKMASSSAGALIGRGNSKNPTVPPPDPNPPTIPVGGGIGPLKPFIGVGGGGGTQISGGVGVSF